MSVSPWSRALPQSPWIRTAGHAFQAITGDEAGPLVRGVLESHSGLDWAALHVWERDPGMPGWNGFEPGKSALVLEVESAFRSQLQERGDARHESVGVNVEPNAKVLDIILVEPNRWWIGSHLAEHLEQQWPGGVPTIQPPENLLSRAYLKLAEAIAWSQMPLARGDRVVEIGSAPGGACQLLLELGLHVTGVDPAEMDPMVMQHPRFTHIRARSLQVKRRLFSPFKWLVCDANVAPNYTLDTVEGIVTYPTSRFEGLILTMKLSEWEQASKLQEHLERVRSWGFGRVQARQLAHNRREYCLVATRNR